MQLFTTKKVVGFIIYMNSEGLSWYNVWYIGGSVKCDNESAKKQEHIDEAALQTLFQKLMFLD